MTMMTSQQNISTTLRSCIPLPHNPETKFGKIRLEFGTEFGMMEQFKNAIRKYSIQMNREAFFSQGAGSSATMKLIHWRFTVQGETSHLVTKLKHWWMSIRVLRVIEVGQSLELISKIRICPNLSHKESQDLFTVEFDICVGERMMFRTMEKTKDVFEGT
ncbi:hypothetical protein Ahy_B08g092654 [Arachis hypogaea]|uniref:Uncharacterized protein n=1 Tax=Arachis hypogaea TaxID=3818 RepID=A0A444Y4D8_ARAHY|nr:hypothetical protein Ahy_B08g092654 [Arachis hypogaea]